MTEKKRATQTSSDTEKKRLVKTSHSQRPTSSDASYVSSIPAGESEKRTSEWLSLALRAARAGSWDWDMQTGRLTWSQEFLELFGIDADTEPSFQIWRSIVHPEDRDPADARIRLAVDSRSFLENEYRIIRPDGSHRWILAQGVTSYDESGCPVRMSGICMDITERKLAEQEVRRNEERHRTILETAMDGIWVTDMTGHLLEVNKAYCEMTGYSEQELLGMRIDDIEVIESSQDVQRHLQKTVRQGCDRFESQHRCKDGRVIDVEVGVQHKSFHGGQMIAFVRDITVRKRTEEAIRQSETRYRTIVENVNDAFYIHDFEGIILEVNQNACTMVGYKRDELVGSRLAMIDSQENTQHLPDRMKTLMERGSILFEGQHVRKNGTFVSVEVSAKVVHLRGKGVVQSFVRDISERKTMEEERIRNQHLESLGLLAGGIAHDFNNLLAGILGNIEMAKVSSPAGGKPLDYLEKALGVTERAKALTDQLLTFSKGGSPFRRPGDLGQLARYTVPFALSGSSITPVFTVAPDLWVCEFDEGQIGQVLDNLIINAQQAMPMGGHIEIGIQNVSLDDPEAQRSGRFVMISVHDHGTGIPDNLLPRIFDPFFTTKQKGNGLGLATSHSIVQKHEGFIEVESTLGEGSTFRIYLPASGQDFGDPKSLPSNPHVGSGRFLLMDDEEFMRDLTSDMLKSMGYAVVTVQDGLEACTEAEQAVEAGAPFKGIILDLTVPGGRGGREVVRSLREIDPNVVLIAASGYSADPVMAAPAQYGFSGSIHKPFSLADLGDLLNHTMNRSRDS